MKSCLLVIFSLMTGIKASDEVTVCARGWIQFICKYPQENKKYRSVEVSIPKGWRLQTLKTNVWENIGRFSLYHDTLNKSLRVAIKRIKRSDNGDYKCTFLPPSNGKHGKKIEIDDDIKQCRGPVIYTAGITANIIISCDSKPQKPNIFCKDIDCTSEDILSSESSRKSNGRFIFTPTADGFSVSIRNVSSQDAGFYWCGFESADRTYRVSLTKVRLDVKKLSTVTSSTSSTTPTTDRIQGGSWLTAVTAVAVCVAVLVLVVVLVVVYKRFECSNNSTDGDAPNKEAVYEEIQESSLKSDPGISLKTVYMTATFPTNPAAFMDYSTVNFQNGSGEVTGDVYSTVLDSSQHPSYSTVNHPSRVSKDPFHSTVKQH
ncbi:uncharacterized protein LOC111568424 [Amphiprion ocellaris]|uniref:uncharacterized protein LOC111568424 n=1 Tax=Amphiprion ocellaris TaxID=80972 RepID=UPI0024117ACC|nr:uncharacterized protein LOC111568424 [Amphiprion ocellaris]